MKRFILALLLLVLTAVPVLGMEASESAQPATVSATLEIEKVTRQDITERTSEVKDKLEGYLEQKEIGQLSWHNFLQHSIRQAVDKGVSTNTIVLVLLFPLVAGMIAAARHLLGLTGFGIFVPAMLSVAFVAIGIKAGVVMLVIIFVGAALGRSLTKKLKMQYLPRMALMMWLVSIVVLGVLLGAVNINLGSLSAVSIFPIMILMLLTENFIEVQTGKSRHEAIQVMIQTMVMAIVGALILRTSFVQKWALLNPEIFLLSVAFLNIYVGKYTGLRVMEMWKYRKLIK